MTIPADNKLKSFALTLALGGVLIAVAGLAYLFLTPKTYQASARIKVTDWVHARDAGQPMNLRLIPGECELLRSNAMLDPVINNLGLTELWAKRYSAGAAPGADEIRARLRSKALIHPLPNSSLLEILVTSEDRDETSKIANELARVYLDYRKTQRQELIGGKLEGLKQQWDEQGKKIQAAQTTVDTLYFQIVKARATNHAQLYDPDAYDALLGKKIEFEGRYVARKNQLEQLKKLPPDELIQVLSTLDENSELTPPLLQLSKAKSVLLHANLEHAPDSQEVKDATLVVEGLNKKIADLASSTITDKQNELLDLTLKLQAIGGRLNNASTNVNQVNIQDASYQQALTNLNQLKAERDGLQQTMSDVETAEASRPAGITAELIDSAEPPEKPFTPDGRLGMGILGGGGFMMLAGVILLLVSLRPISEPIKKPA